MEKRVTADNIRRVLEYAKELDKMDLDSIPSVKFLKADGKSRDEIIVCLLKTKFTPQEVSDYQTYLKYCDYVAFSKQIDTLNTLMESTGDLFTEKHEAGRKQRIIRDRQREVEFKLRDALPLVRLNIEYSHVEKGFDDYVAVNTRTGMTLAQKSDTLAAMKSKGLIYRTLKKKEIVSQEEDTASYHESAAEEVRAAYTEYARLVKVYCDYLREAFYRMLDNKDIAEAVYLYTNMPTIKADDAYEIKRAYNHKFTNEEKEMLYKKFIAEASFDQETIVTGEVFFNAVLRFVTKYYTIMDGRLEMKKSDCINKIEELSIKQRQIATTMRDGQDGIKPFENSDQETLTLIYTANHKK